MRIILCVFFLSLITAFSIEAQDIDSTGAIRIKIDVDSVSLTVDGNLTKLDSYGNSLQKDTWFILNMIHGDHKLVFTKGERDSIEKNINVIFEQVSSIDVHFLTVSPDTTLEIPGTAFLSLASDPESVRVVIDNFPDTLITPAATSVSSGGHTMTAVSEGFDQLSHKMNFQADKNISIRFLMSFSQPVQLTAEDIEMEYKPLVTLKNEKAAEAQKMAFMNLAETFMIIPLGQGILARLLLGNGNTSGADVLISVGAGLMAGSYLLGRILPKRKLARIRAFNEEANALNTEIKFQNKEIDDILEQKNGQIISEWIAKNEDRGKVEVNIEED